MDFFDLIRAGNLEEIKRQAGANHSLLTTPDSKGFSPLILACYVNQEEVVKYLLEEGVAVNGRDIMGNTALMGVAFKGNVSIAKLLLEYGADINLQNKKKETALIYAVSFAQTSMAKLLLEAGADKTLTAEDGNTASDYAEFKGLGELETLLKNY